MPHPLTPTSHSFVDYEVYSSGHLDALRDLFGSVWGARRSREYDEKHWDQTIIGTAPGVVALVENRVVGFYAVWPVPLTDGACTVIGGQPIDSMVHRDFQGRGLLREIGSRCYQECVRRSITVMYGAPNRAALAGNVGGLNWSHVSEIVDYVRPIVRRRPEKGSLAKLAEQDLTLGDVLVSASPEGFDRVVKFCSNGSHEKNNGRVWRIPFSPEWFRYRYNSTPDVRYVSLTRNRGDEITGTAICGIRFKGLGGGSVSKLTIGELSGRDATTRRELIAGTIRLAAIVGAPYVLAKSSRGDVGLTLLCAGFLPYRRTPLISRSLDASCHRANPLSRSGWSLAGGAFDTI